MAPPRKAKAAPSASGTKQPTSTQLLSPSSTRIPGPSTTTTTTTKRRRKVKKEKPAKEANAGDLEQSEQAAVAGVPAVPTPQPTDPLPSTIRNHIPSPDTATTSPEKRIAPMSTSPNKRPRLEGSFSPASPPYHLAQVAKSGEQIKPIQPDTPISPSYMSSASQPNGENKEAQLELVTMDVEMENTQDASHKRTDHDRQSGQEAGPAATEESIADIPTLCQDPVPLSQPHLSHNLISLYSLNSLAASVARRDPITGEKINKLRKSYEGKVKQLHLSGKNKPITRPGELTGLLSQPEDTEPWQLDTFDDSIFDRALSMTMVGVALQEERKWKMVVGPDEPTKAKPGLNPALKKQSQGPAIHPIPDQQRQAGENSAQRPQRPGRKRRYNDSSFSGYGETFDEDMAESTGAEDDSRGGPKKKRRKDFPGSSTLGMSERPGGFNNMVRVNQH